MFYLFICTSVEGRDNQDALLFICLGTTAVWVSGLLMKINLWDFMWFWILFLFVWNLSTHKHTHTHTHTQTHKQDCTVVRHDTKFTEDIIWMCECVCVCVCVRGCVCLWVLCIVCVSITYSGPMCCVCFIFVCGCLLCESFLGQI